MPVTYNSFNPAFSSVTFVFSSSEEIDTAGAVEEFIAFDDSGEELVIAEAGEEFVTVEAFEHSGEELAHSCSMHFKHGGTNSS